MTIIGNEDSRLTTNCDRLANAAFPVRNLREARGLTQKALSCAAGINIRQIQKLESGEIRPENLTLKNALALAAALGCDPKDLIN